MRSHHALHRSFPRIHAAARLRPPRSYRLQSRYSFESRRYRPNGGAQFRSRARRRFQLPRGNTVMRRRIMAGNWKMYKTPRETVEFFERFKPLVANKPANKNHCEVVVFPPAICVPAAFAAANGSDIGVGGQNIYWGKEGAYTGEISGEMLRAAGATWVL